MGAACRRNWLGIATLLAGLMLDGAAAAQQSPPIEADTDQPIEISADSLEVQQDKQIAIFRGNVDARQGRIRLNADELKVHYRTQSTASQQASGLDGSIVRIDAIGQVKVASPTETARGNVGVYDVAAGEITLTGNVVLTRGPNVIRGERLVMNMGTGRSRVESGDSGRVRGLFVPPEDDKSQEEKEAR